METALPYLIGITGFVIAVAGVIKGVVDKAELQVQLALGSREDCLDELATARDEILRLREIIFRYAPASVAVTIGGDAVGGNKSTGRDEITTRRDSSQRE